MNLDVGNWELFDFVKIFDIKKGFYNKKPEPSGVGTIPFLGATDSNNGVTEHYTYVHVLLGKHADTGNVVRNQTAHAGDSAVLTSMYSAMRRS